MKEFTFEEAIAKKPSPDAVKKSFSFEEALGKKPSPEPVLAEPTDQPMGEGLGSAIMGAVSDEPSVFGTPVDPRSKSVLGRVPLASVPAPTVDAQKNLEAMERSGSPGSVMFEPGRRLQRLERGFARQKAVQDQIRQAEENIRQFNAEKLQREKEEQGLYGPIDLTQDIAVATAKAAVGLGQFSVGLATALTGWYPDNPLGVGQWGKMMSKLGYNPEQTNEFFTGLGTPIYQTQQQEVDAAEGFFGTLKALAVNPVALTMSVVEALPGTVTAGAAGGQLTRLLMTKAADEAAERGLKGYAANKFIKDKVKDQVPKIAAAASTAEGAMTVGQISEEASRQGREWGQYIAPALSAGLGTAAIGMLSNKAARKLGVGDIETEIAARTAGVKGVGIGTAKDPFAKALYKEMAKEGLLEELPQSAQEQIFTNLALGKPWDEGVGKASAQGLMSGAAMAGGRASLAKALNRTGELIAEQAEKTRLERERGGMPMTAEELARSKGFLGGKKKSLDSLISDLEAEIDRLGQEDEGNVQGEPDVGQPITQTSGAGVSVAGQPSAEPPAPGAGIVEPSGVVSAGQDVAAVAEGAPAEPVTLNLNTYTNVSYIDPNTKEKVTLDFTKAYKDKDEDGNEQIYVPGTGEYDYNLDLLLEEAPSESKATISLIKEAILNKLASEPTETAPVATLTEDQRLAQEEADAERAAIQSEGAAVAAPVTDEDIPFGSATAPAPTEVSRETPATTAPAPALSTALVPVTPELQKDLKRDSSPYGDDLENIIDENSPTGLWNGAVYYAGTPEVYGKGINQRAEFPVSLIPITTLAEAQEAESNGMAVYAVTKPQQKTVAELEAEIAKLKGQRNKLLTPTGKEPKKGTKKAAEWDALTEQMNRLWEQVSGIESGRITTGAPALPAPITVASESRGKDDFGNAVTDVALSNGSKYQIVRLNSTESMGLPGWHDANKFGPTEGGFLGNTKEEAIQELIRRETQRRQQPPLITAEPFTIDVEARVVADTVNNELSPDELRRLGAHYGLSPNSEKFIERVKNDIVRFATEGAAAVAASIRDIIKKLHAGVLSVAMIFNPMNISVPEFVAYPKATVTRTEQVFATLPEGTEEMSASGKQAYQTLYASLKNRLIAEDKLFTIADKPTGHTYVFLPDGTLLIKTKTLFGKAFGDFYKGNNNLPQNRITPAGLFTFGLRDATRGPDEAKTAGEYDYGKVFVLDKVIDGQYSMTVMHSVWLNESDAAARAQALRSPEQTDSRYSFGCINVDKDTYGFLVANHLNQMDGSSVFIVPDDPTNLADLLSGKPENRDGLERNTFTPATQEVVEDADSAKQDPVVIAQQEADRRRAIFKSIVGNATKTATDAPQSVAELVKANLTGVNKIVQFYKDGKLTLEEFADQMLRIQERIANAAEAKRYALNKRLRGPERVMGALLEAKRKGRISPETADFAIWFLMQNPAMATNLGIKIAVPENKKVAEALEGTTGFYVPFEELVRIITEKDADTGLYYVTRADVAVHEILHHLERMLPNEMRRTIRNEWKKQFKAAAKKAQESGDKNQILYFEALTIANANNSAEFFKIAERMITDGDVPQSLYVFFNPSEFWAVRGSALLAGRYDASSKGRFAKIGQYLREFIQTLKNIFGMKSDAPIIKGLEAVLRGDGTFFSEEMLGQSDSAEPLKQVTPKGLHPDVASAIARNDINGTLNAIARNTSGFYSELAKRLVGLNLPTSIAFNNERALVRKVIDDRSTPQQVRLFAYLSREAPKFYAQYFKDYDKAENLERVFEGLRKLPGAGINIGPVNTELADVRFAYNKSMPGLTANGFFAPSVDAINIRPDANFGTSNRVVLHEIVHAATEYMLRKQLSTMTDQQKEAVRYLEELYQYAQTKLSPDEYGFTDISEFVAEVMTNPKFQAKLKAIPYATRKTSLFNRFLQVIANLFGVGNLASEAMSAINEIVSAERPSGIQAIPLVFARGRRARGPISKPSTYRVAESVDGSIKGMIDAVVKGRVSLDDAVKTLASALWEARNTRLREVILPALQLRHLKDLTRNIFPQITGAVNIVEQMTSFRGTKIQIAEKIVKDWVALQASDPRRSRLMSLIMMEATLRGRDPDDGVPSGGAPDALDNAWNGLTPEYQALYRRVRQFYADSVNEMVRTMKQRALGLPKAERQAMIRKIDEQFGSDKLRRPYFPLRRFGDYWFQVGKGDFKEFYMFESPGARNVAFNMRRRELQMGNAQQRAAAETMHRGNRFSEIYSQNTSTTQVLRDVEEIVGGLTATSVDEIKSEIKDSINQLVYLLLPQQSMRKMFINRKGIQGASSDMLRVFAHSAVHSAYQQARFKFAEPFINNIINAREYIKNLEQSKAISPEKGEVYKDYVNELEARTKYTLGTEDTSKGAKISARIRNFVFQMMMSAPASAIVNVIGMTAFTMPYIGGRYGYAETNALMLKNLGFYTATVPQKTLLPLATGNFYQVEFPSIVASPYLSPLARRAAEQFVRDGDFQISMTYDMVGLGERPSALYTGVEAAVTKMFSGMFHQMEQLNRQVAMVTTVELAYKKYLGAEVRDLTGVVQRDPATGQPLTYTEEQAYAKAIEEARDIAGLTLGDFSRQMKGRYFVNNIASVVLQFKQYAVLLSYALFRNAYLSMGAPFSGNELKQFRQQMIADKVSPDVIEQRIKEIKAFRKESYKEARRRLAGVMGVTWLYGGVEAQPFFSLLGPILSLFGVGDDDDDEFDDWKNWFYNYMQTNVGGLAGDMLEKLGMESTKSQEAGEALGMAIARGPVSALTGTSLTDRVSIDLKNVWWRDPRYTPDARESLLETVIANVGPAAGLALNWADGVNLINEGKYQKAMEKMLPAIVGKPLTAYRLGTEGATNREGTVIGRLFAESFTTWELAMQAIGFQPEKLARAQKGAIQAKTYEQKILDRKERLLDRLWLERESEARVDVEIAIAEFNMMYPEVAITQDAVEKSFERRRQIKAEAEEAGAQLNEKLRTRTLPMLRYGVQ